MAPIDPAQVALGKSLMGKTLRFRHMTEPWGTVSQVMRDGMIEFDDKGGYFAPHLFAVVDPTPAIKDRSRLPKKRKVT